MLNNVLEIHELMVLAVSGNSLQSSHAYSEHNLRMIDIVDDEGISHVKAPGCYYCQIVLFHRYIKMKP